jgi:peptidoglycan/xylan/chitin deacetylase (PgdA/CDA1 family)
MSHLDLGRGALIVSLDLELAWGTFDLWGPGATDIPRPLAEIFLQTREVVIDALLDLFRQHDVPATWAVVGHLFLDHCEPVNGVKHPDMPRPTHGWFKGDWYARDPASTVEADPIWYGRDIVKKIIRAEPRQEIGCHSFSHVIFGDEGCSEEVAESEVRKCVALARDLGIELRSLVFPRSQEGHHEILSKYGFSCYRTPRPGWFGALGGRARGLARLVNDLFGLSPPCAVVKKQPTGLWSMSASAYYRSVVGAGRFVPIRSRVRQCVKGIDKAIDTKGVFHLCLHPWNLAVETERLIEGLRRVLRYAAEARLEGRLDLLSMGQLAERMETSWCAHAADSHLAQLEARDAEGAAG